MGEIPAGTRLERNLLVTSEVAIDFLGNEEARVLSTPHLVAFLEMASRDAVKGLLDPGQDTVGTRIDLRHLAATPIGMHVRLSAEVTAVEDRRITFRIEAHDEREKIGEGTHERFIIHIGRFATRLSAKKAGL